MASTVTLTTALAVVGDIVTAVEVWRKSHRTFQDDVTLAEAIITSLTSHNIGVQDVTEVLAAIKPYLGLIVAASGGKA